jgi:hypothetical protein
MFNLLGSTISLLNTFQYHEHLVKHVTRNILMTANEGNQPFGSPLTSLSQLGQQK